MAYPKHVIYKTPSERLDDAAFEALRSSVWSPEMAVGKLRTCVLCDMELMIALFGYDRIDQQLLAKLQERHDAIRGGAVDEQPGDDDEIGGDAVADDAGQRGSDTQEKTARPSAPQSQTPAEKPVGGGHAQIANQATNASSSTPAPWSKADIAKAPAKIPDLSEERAKRVVQNKPAVSQTMMRKVAVRHAKVLLQNITCNGKPLGTLTAHEALTWADGVDTMENEKIAKSEKRIAVEKKQIAASRHRKTEVHVVRVLATGLPPTQNLEEWYDVFPEEYQKRIDTLRSEGAAHA